jgi:pre-mRNA-splicing factor SYF1
MPRIWEDYCQFLADQKYVTRTREAFDRALRALPVTQHERIWKAYLAFVQRCGVPELALRVYRRYLKLNRNAIHDYVEYLVAAEQFDEAAKQIAAAIDQMARRPDAAKAAVKAVAAAAADGKTDAASSDVTADAAERALWLKLVDLVAKHAHAVRSVRLEPIVRSALVRFRSDAARLWIALADYAIRLGSLEKARDVFEEALGSVKAVRDFSQIWDAYTRFEDELIAIEMVREARRCACAHVCA